MKSSKQCTAYARGLRLILVSVILLAATRAQAALIYPLGDAAQYAVLGMGGTNAFHGEIEVYQSGTVITGNVGAGPFADWTHGMDATINGALNYDTTDSLPIITGTITGGTHQISMTSAVNDAINAENLYNALTPTQTFTTLNENQIIVGNGGLNVIRVTDTVLIQGTVVLKKNLFLQGTAADSFVFQITHAGPSSSHELTLSGTDMFLLGGVTPDNILWDLHGTGGGIVISSGALVYGTFLAPQRDVLVDASTVIGRVIGGGGPDAQSNSMSVHSTSTITLPIAIPEPATAALLAPGLLLLITRSRRRMWSTKD